MTVSRATPSGLEWGADTAERPEAFPPVPPGAGFSEGVTDGAGDSGFQMTCNVFDPDFWSSSPLEVGGLIGVPLKRRGTEGEEETEAVLFIRDIWEDESGLWLTGRFLGAAHPWGKDWGIKTISREKKYIHLCRYGVHACLEDSSAYYHVEDFQVWPLGAQPPDYVEKGMIREWKKLVEELRGPHRAPTTPGAGGAEEPTGAPGGDRLSALKSRLAQARGTGARAPHQEVAAPAEPTTLVKFAPQPLVIPDHAPVEAPQRERTPRKERNRRSDSREKDRDRGRRRDQVRDALVTAASRQARKERRRGDSRDDSRERSRKRRRSRRRSRRRDRSDSRRRSSRSSSPDLVPPLQRKAEKEPGSVLRLLMRNIHDALAESAVTQDAGGSPLGSGNKVSAYYQVVAKPQMGGKVRDLRELETISRCLDYLRNGQLPELGDALAGRFMAVETAAISNNWADAQHLEVVKVRSAGVAPPGVMLQAQRHARQVEKATKGSQWKKPYYGGGGGRDSGQKGDEKSPQKGKGKGGKKGGGKTPTHEEAAETTRKPTAKQLRQQLPDDA